MPSSRILVVDDVPVNIQLLVTYLAAEGYDVVSAKDGHDAMKAVKEHQPDLILLDVMMPKMNGFKVCEAIKSDDATKFIPVILVTALNELEDKVKGMNSGADDFLAKPFNKLELLVRVRSLLRIKHLHDELQEKVIELQRTKEELRQLAITDGLTGLYNYRYFKEQLLQELKRAQRHSLNISVVMIDIDHFKQYNDKNGHPAGDVVLKDIARLLRDNIRNIDLAARYGGEEFSLILIETDKPSAKIVSEKIRKLVEDYGFAYESSQPDGKLTISTGVAKFPEDGEDFDTLVSKADQRLYRAKEAGRNLIFVDS
ncbi:diguanylate cyclase [candidate division KSB1 bacterium]|nr:diguanylate cyclase [candidate division KSB1 bacterium]